ncbi:Flagellar hook-basal body complex protein FliE [Gammaproteobacteria bacterium]
MSQINNIDSFMTQMRLAAARTRGLDALKETVAAPTAGASGQPPFIDFGQVLKNSLESVNQLQHTSQGLQTALEEGNKEISLAQVMIASQKSSLAFQATVEVRNKLLDAYKEVMSMQV